jgi:hypothetical protein
MSDKPNESRPGDGVRLAAAVMCEEVSQRAAALAERLRDKAPLPAAAVAGVLVEANRQATRLEKHDARLTPGGKG